MIYFNSQFYAYMYVTYLSEEQIKHVENLLQYNPENGYKAVSCTCKLWKQSVLVLVVVGMKDVPNWKLLITNMARCLNWKINSNVHANLVPRVYGVSWPSGLVHWTRVLVLSECGFESQPGRSLVSLSKTL